MKRPVLYVPAGVNGAGKSSVGGHLLARAGLTWFNPDTFARELVADTGCSQNQANAIAWHEGVRRMDFAVANQLNFAIETTLGGESMTRKIHAASRTHDVMIWFCGLRSAEQHIARVKARVALGGHDIPVAKIHERFQTARENLIVLMPVIARLKVYDNSVEAAPGAEVPDPHLLLDMRLGKLLWPTLPQDLCNTPTWAKPILEAALS